MFHGLGASRDKPQIETIFDAISAGDIAEFTREMMAVNLAGLVAGQQRMLQTA